MKIYSKDNIQTAAGQSGIEIKEMILKLTQDYAPGALQFIDVGAGTGILLEILRSSRPTGAFVGVDYLSRPEGYEWCGWFQRDLNKEFGDLPPAEVVVCSEVIEHLENPRQTMRQLRQLMRNGGVLILTTPNQVSLRSLASLVFGGHFVAFLDTCYPEHITALLPRDVERMAAEVGLEVAAVTYSNVGRVPKLTKSTWQQISFGRLKGRLWSDNVAFVLREARHAHA